MKGMRAFVTGATGFVGINLVDVLHAAGWRITALVRPGARGEPLARSGVTLAEREVRAGIERGLDAVLLNPVHVMGRHDRGNWSRLVLMAAEGRLPGIPPGSGSFCHREEVARVHLAAAERGRRGASYLLGGADATFLELVRTIGEVTGRRVPTCIAPAALLRAYGRVSQWWSALSRREPETTPEGVAVACAHTHADSTRAAGDLGYREVPLRAIVADCVAWLRGEGRLAAG